MASIERSQSFSNTLSAPSSPSPEWGADSVTLKEFASKRSVPAFAKVVKGNYMTLGNNKFSFSKQHHEVFIHSIKVGVKVLAHCLRRVDAHSVSRRGGHNVYTSTRLYTVDQRLAIPISYQGWFELLSEDGQSARVISSVHELSKVKPDRCLVRENIKAYLITDGKMTFEKTMIVLAGEQLTLSGELSLPSPAENKKIKLLRCHDTKGEAVYLSFDQKGAFTPIAGEKDFTGAFNIRDVIRRFRLPLTVKLIQGVWPKVDPSRFTGLVRLDWVYTDETAFVCPIEKTHVRLLPVPTDANLHLVSAVNHKQLSSTQQFRFMMTKCNRMISNYNNTLHLIVQVPDAAVKRKGHSNANVFSLPFESTESNSTRSRRREERLMNEIDDLYAYIREGGVPPKSKFTYDSDEESYWEEPAYESLDDFQARLRALDAGQKVSYHAKYTPRDPTQLPVEMFPVSGKTTAAVADSSVYGVISGSAKGTSSTPQEPTNTDNKNNSKAQNPPPLPARPADLQSNPSSSSSSQKTAINKDETKTAPETNAIKTDTEPPPLPTRRYSDATVTVVSNLGLVSSSQSSGSPTHSSKQPPSPQEKVSNKGRHSRPGMVQSKSVESNSRTHKVPVPRPSLESKDKRGSQDSHSTSSSSGNTQTRNMIARDFKDSDISSVTRGASSGSSGGRPANNIRKKMQTLYL